MARYSVLSIHWKNHMSLYYLITHIIIIHTHFAVTSFLKAFTLKQKNNKEGMY